jgi:hypothetical protein
MHLGVARLCLDCHEVHDLERCPTCTSEAFAFITRWITLEDGAPRMPLRRQDANHEAEKLNSYREMLQPGRRHRRKGRWLRTGGVLIAAGYMARWGWRLISREVDERGPQPPRGPAGTTS